MSSPGQQRRRVHSTVRRKNMCYLLVSEDAERSTTRQCSAQHDVADHARRHHASQEKKTATLHSPDNVHCCHTVLLQLALLHT